MSSLLGSYLLQLPTRPLRSPRCCDGCYSSGGCSQNSRAEIGIGQSCRLEFSPCRVGNDCSSNSAQFLGQSLSLSSFRSGRQSKDGEAVKSSSSGGRFQWRSVDGQTTYATEVSREPNIPCDICKGKGWLVCDFCDGQQVNVLARNSRIYRRCPSCRAAGVVICPRCKVFKCVSFPDDKDGGIIL